MSPSTRVATRSDLLKLLCEAAELEHGIACSYLYAAFSLKRDISEGGMTWEEQQKVRRWAAQIYFVASQEMLHLAHTCNIYNALGGEHLNLAGLDIEVTFTPGHSPGHVTYLIEDALFSGDVLFQDSVGRTDLPGGDWPTLLESIRTLVDSLPPETTVYPGHMGVTTLGAERASNPFLQELAER